MLVPDWMMLPTALIIGSWLGVLIRRWPQGRPVAMARSACEHCGHKLAARDLVPLLSFIWLRGSCRHCGAPIGWFHPAIELAALAVAVAVLAAGGSGWPGWAAAALGWSLLAASWIDAETFRLPDLITLPLILAGLCVTWLFQPGAIYGHALAAALGYGAFRLLDAAFLALQGRHGLGQGDAKLLAAAGAWLGLSPLPYTVMAAGLVGIGVAVFSARSKGLQRHQPIAFGPALALSFFAAFLAGGCGG
jgi:leader peptidase (prepilin peptidase)/N-methyltransferase